MGMSAGCPRGCPLAASALPVRRHCCAYVLPNCPRLVSVSKQSAQGCAPSHRLLLPEHLRLDALECCCPGQAVYFGLSRALSVCRRIHVSGASLHMLLSAPSVSRACAVLR